MPSGPSEKSPENPGIKEDATEKADSIIGGSRAAVAATLTMGAIAQNDQDPVATKTPDQTHEISNLLITEIPKDAPWRDILDALKQIQLGFANEHNYQLLIMAIEEGMLGKDGFNATIEGIRLDIQPGESDEDLRQKLAEFINSLCQFES